MVRKKRLGIGAQCSVLSKYMHPAKTISDKYPNRTANHRIENLLCVKEDTKNVKRRQQRVIVFRHDDFEGVEIYCVRRWVKVIEEGAEEHLFQQAANEQQNTGGPEAENAPEGENQIVLGEEIFNAGNNAEDIALVLNQGLNVDCDNQPAPENIPEPGQAQQNNNNHQQDWGWDGMCNRDTTSAQNHRPAIIGVHGVTLEVMSLVGMFLIFFSKALS